MNFFLRVYKNYGNFKGRDTRQQYWIFVLLYTLAYCALILLDISIGTYFSMIYYVVGILPLTSLGTRRLHDIDKTGWWQLIMFIPLGVFVLMVLYSMKGTKGDNRFGEDPKNIASE